MEKEFNFKSRELFSELKNCEKNGITELTVHDAEISGNKHKLLQFIRVVKKDSPNLFVSIKINPFIIDNEICNALLDINCSVELDFLPNEKGFDKKLYSKKCTLLNNTGLVFGVNLYYADSSKDSLKSFKDRLDFTVFQYPNHIDFPQTENSIANSTAKVSALFSAQDIRYARDLAFATRCFYSSGRAVPWFNSLMKALHLQPSVFFADFAEWQRVNNCDFKSGYIPENEKHSELEKMQLLFADMKLEEKKLGQLLPVVNDIIKLNGAISRAVAEGEEPEIQLEYNPEDLLSPESLDFQAFSNDVCMESCSCKIFIDEYGELQFKLKN